MEVSFSCDRFTVSSTNSLRNQRQAEGPGNDNQKPVKKLKRWFKNAFKKRHDFSRSLSSARLAFNALVALEAVHHATQQLSKRRRLWFYKKNGMVVWSPPWRGVLEIRVWFFQIQESPRAFVKLFRNAVENWLLQKVYPVEYTREQTETELWQLVWSGLSRWFLW